MYDRKWNNINPYAMKIVDIPRNILNEITLNVFQQDYVSAVS